MTEAPENANGNTSGESITVSDAAERLGITLPRLQRLLRRPDFAAHVHKAEHQTRTGTRTVTLVSVSVLPALSSVAAEQKREHYGPNHYRSEPASEATCGGRAGSETSGPLVQAVIAQMEARLRDKDAEIERLARLLDDANQRQRLTLEALAREQALRALPAPQEARQEARTGPETGHLGQMTGPVADDTRNGTQAPQTGTETAKMRGSWLGWLLFGRGRGK